MLKIIPLGGLGEIGLNMMVFEYKDTIFIIDAGLMFPEDYMLGIDYVIPDMEYLKEVKDKISGIILTHAHEDHIGALPHLLRKINAPVFSTPFTLEMVKRKIEDSGISLPDIFHPISLNESLRFGVFEIEFIRVAHSVVDGIGLAIRTPEGLIVHTGDFKISQTFANGLETDISRFAQLGREGVLALLSDSTNVEKEGYTLSDSKIGETLSRIAANASGRMIIAVFASSIIRIQQIVDIAVKYGRKIVFNGRSMENSVEIARQLGYLRIPENLEIKISQVRNFSDKDVLIITTGSQGEPMSALARMADGTHKQIRIQTNDTVVLSSRFIPGNEKAIATIINSLYRQGADVIYEKISDIHVSGHASREELKLMINLTKPKHFIPIHGEYRHLVLHARLAKQIGVKSENTILIENGQVLVFDEKGGRIEGSISTGRVLVDGKGIGDVGYSVLRERRVLAEDGFVFVALAFDEETGVMIHGPEIISKGFVFETETGYLLEDAQCVILEIVEEIQPEVPQRLDKIRSKMLTALRQYFFFTIGRRPVILPFIIEV